MAVETLRNLVRTYPHLLDLSVPLPGARHDLIARGDLVTIIAGSGPAGHPPTAAWEVMELVGQGDNQFASLRRLDTGSRYKWVRSDNLRVGKDAHEEHYLANTITAARRFMALVERYQTQGLTHADAFRRASAEDEIAADAYRAAGVGLSLEPEATPVISLSARPNESFDALAARYATEHKMPLRRAIHEVGKLRPDLANAR